ncbi:NnrS family protein [Leisingera methylohalidivorans]|uniref:Short-chain dehydrogenase n=1 Tax=Leisingera methylohalidivorans DSM 14336 TaxID=999552 RepID=V9VSI5_9RHOB|nr:NnrS family protein [Leisingera methylohalidivorans]AHD01716.1 short-chain dehydrogenase [Leisingera methylohalidivorans DSM 14336]
MAARPDYSGPVLFSYGFRPFFLGACLFALAVIPAWLLIWQGTLTYSGPFLPVDWHIHEMIFGYGAAVVAGFLFTAVPNWTGRMPARGWPLALLSGLWLLGRLAAAGWLGLPALGVMAVDCAFLAAVIAMIAREIIAGENWRNLKVLVPITLLGAANACFHVEVMSEGAADISRRLGIAVLIFLIMLIGGRIIPGFTRNWQAKRGAAKMPVPFGKFDAVTLASGAAALLAWTAAPWAAASGVLLLAAGLLHALRVARWCGLAGLGEPLLLMLHASYALVPAGLIAAAAVPFGLLEPAAAAHILGIGAVGGMTLAVMMRATLGHSGRLLVAGPVLTAAFALVIASAALRLAGSTELAAGWDGITVSAALWTAGFVLMVLKAGPWLANRRIGSKLVSGAQAKNRNLGEN